MEMRTLFFALSLAILMGIGTKASLAQDVFWASKVSFSQNEFGPNDGAAINVLGEPDAIPYGSPNPNTFRLKSLNGFGRVVVSFEKNLLAKQVLIFENHLPGRVHRVIAFDANENKKIVYDGGHKIADAFRILSIPIEGDGIYINKIEISLLAHYENGHSEIDAIGISPSEDPLLAKTLAEKYGIDQKISAAGFSNYSELKKVNLDVEINTKEAELKPIISADGNTLYFSRQNHSSNIGGKNDEQDIYVSQRFGDRWSKAENLGGPINNLHPNGIVALTPDGLGMYIINEYPTEGSFRKGLSFSRYENGKWQRPETVKIKGLYNFSPFVDYTISADGQIMILAMKRIDSKGDMDLYVSFNEGGHHWSAPKSMGRVINTSRDDFAPYLASDNETLYFASFGHDGYGDADIFVTRRMDDTWINWTKPENLGPEINSSGFDAYLTIPATGGEAFMVSTEGSIGNSRDIYRVILDPQHLPKTSLQILGQLVDKNTLEPITGEVRISSKKNKSTSVYSMPEDGSYQVWALTGYHWSIEATAVGYQPVNEALDLSKIKDGILIKTIFMNPSRKENYDYLTVSNTISTIGLPGTFRSATKEESSKVAPTSKTVLKVLDAETESLIEPEMIATNDKISKISPGRFEFELIGKNPEVKVSHPGYLSWQGNIQSLIWDQDAYRLPLKKLKENEPFVLENLLFHQGTDQPLVMSQNPLQELLDILLSNPQIMVTLHGHTDNVGDKTLNLKLSEQRVAKVKELLLESGVEGHRIGLKAYGGEKPIASNAHESTRRLNRRVEYTLHLISSLVSE